MKIRILITGGTIDDCHKVPKSRRCRTYISQMIKQARIIVPIVLEHIFQKDSRDIDTVDLEKILSASKNCKEQHILITHGTFTMSETARYLGSKIKNKTIVLTGSAIPFIDKNSDAMFNFGSALLAVQLLPAGVYVVMNGKVFSFDNVEKNLFDGKFVENK